MARVQQLDDEAVVTFAARLTSKIKDLKFKLPQKEVIELFLSGLEPELQKMTRAKLDGEESLQEAVALAKVKEVELGKVRAAERARKPRSSGNSNNNSNINSNNSNDKCNKCGSNRKETL